MSAPSPRLVDPIHLFNERGASLLTIDHLAARNRELELEIEELADKVRRLTTRLKVIAGYDEDDDLAE